MRSTILILGILFSTIGFANDSISISGKIINTTDNKLIIEGELFEKIIILKEDGTFNETLEILYEGSYTLKTKKNKHSFFLNKKSNLTITADDNDFKKSLKFNGIGAIENNYWLQKQEIVGNKIKAPTLIDFEASNYFKNTVEINTKLTDLLNSSKDLDSSFIDFEKRNIDYLVALRKLNYLKIKDLSFVTKVNKDTIVSNEVIPIDTLFNFDNEADFLFSNEYKSLITNHLKDNVSKSNTNKDKFTAKYYFPEIRKINSPYIKNHVLKLITSDMNADNPDLDSIYNEIIALSSNEKFKKKHHG